MLHDEETLRYVEHALYKLEETKIVFKKHWLINSKLYQPTFNNPKFYTISHYIQCIWDYCSPVNYNTTHNKMTHKYIFKAFYNKTNKKKYKLQIW